MDSMGMDMILLLLKGTSGVRIIDVCCCCWCNPKVGHTSNCTRGPDSKQQQCPFIWPQQPDAPDSLCWVSAPCVQQMNASPASAAASCSNVHPPLLQKPFGADTLRWSLQVMVLDWDVHHGEAGPCRPLRNRSSDALADFALASFHRADLLLRNFPATPTAGLWGGHATCRTSASLYSECMAAL